MICLLKNLKKKKKKSTEQTIKTTTKERELLTKRTFDQSASHEQIQNNINKTS